jgi:hypothetical protein
MTILHYYYVDMGQWQVVIAPNKIEAGVAAEEIEWEDKRAKALCPEAQAWFDGMYAAGYESPFISALKEWQQLAAWQRVAENELAMRVPAIDAFNRADERFPLAAAMMARH